MDLGVSGLASGFDWRSMVDQLAEVDRAPQRSLRTEQSNISARNKAYGVVQSQLTALMAKAKALSEASLFDSRSASSTDSDIATASSVTNSAIGTYKFNILQLATSSVQKGTSDAGNPISSTDDVSGVTLSSAGFSTAVTAGTFTINGRKIEIATSDSLQQVFDKISTATGATVSATYSSATDKISLVAAGGAKIILGSANDTSNFLTVTRLNNNDTDTVVSSGKLGAIRLTSALNASNSKTVISDGGSGAGKFKVNGVEFSFDASTDTVNDILADINNSTAGVTANYDSLNDRFVFTNKTTGDLGVALEDVTGNFLSAIGISGGTLTRGKDLQYNLNDGSEVLTSKSNNIDESSSGITGLTVTALDTGTVSVDVKADTSKVKQAIQDFIADYNKSQTTLDGYTASTTDKNGKVTAGVLAGDRDAFEIATSLRGLINGKISGLTGTVSYLADLGYNSNGNDDTLALSDESAFDAALSSNLSAVKSFFTTATTGFASKMKTYLTSTADTDGTLDDKLKLLSEQVTGIDDQVAAQERIVLATRSAMIDRFVAMEQAQSKINQQLQLINQKFGAA